MIGYKNMKFPKLILVKVDIYYLHNSTTTITSKVKDDDTYTHYMSPGILNYMSPGILIGGDKHSKFFKYYKYINFDKVVDFSLEELTRLKEEKAIEVLSEIDSKLMSILGLIPIT